MERAVAADPGSPLTHAGLAEARWLKYYLTKDKSWLDQAAASVADAERRNPDAARVHYVGGILKANSGWYEQAAEAYRRVIELEPNNGDAYRRVGQVYEQNNKLDEALVALNKAIEVDPQLYKNYQALGAFYVQRGNHSEAAKQFKKAVDLAPDESSARYSLGTAYMNLGRFAEAENELRFAIGLRSTPSALHTLGLTLMYQAREQEAVLYFLEAVRLTPERFSSWMHLGICYRRLNLKTESTQASRRGLELADAEISRNPRNGGVESFLAYLCAQLGQRQRAESEIARALQQSPNDADTRWIAALTYEALGKRDATLGILSVAPPELLADLSRWPDVADLRGDSRFIQLLVSKHVQ
jgi:serine/threonine-protein kinase